MQNIAQIVHQQLPHQESGLVLDFAAFEKNTESILVRSQDKKIRLATKSIRCPGILKLILKSHPRFQGVMTYTLKEALFLRGLGFTDILMGYPTMDQEALSELAQNPQSITLMIDHEDQIKFLTSIARQHQCRFHICLDVDLSLDLPLIRFGVYRSPLQKPRQLEQLLKMILDLPHCFSVRGMMGYEAQIAGVSDKKRPLIQLLKKNKVSKSLQSDAGR
jgi:D-serine deaminase-like pyridoxal phosphate-dependent protein